MRLFAFACLLVACLPTFTVSDGPACDTQTDVANCGTCGNVCGVSDKTRGVACTQGKCVFTCDSPYAHCGPDDSLGCNANLGTDPENCGGCGHSCGGGECAGGRCSPVVVAGDPTANTGLKSLNAVVAIDGYLYGTNWYKPGLVYRVPAQPAQTVEWIAGAGISASASLITTDGTTLAYAVYYNNAPKVGQGLWTVLTDGSQNQRIIPGDGTFNQCDAILYGNEVDSLAFDGTYIYLTHSRDAGSPCPGIIRALADGSNAKLFQPAKLFSGLVADGGSLYFINKTDNTVMAALATLLDAPTPVAKVGKPDAVQVDSAYLYFSDTTARKLYRIPKVGTAGHEDITPQGFTDNFRGAFLVDSNDVYFISPPSGMPQTIYRAKKDGSGPAVAMATVTTDTISAFTQDANALYWTTYGDDAATPKYFSAIYKLAK